MDSSLCYLFGLIFFLSLQSAPHTLGLSHTFPATEILNNFVVSFVFAANVFFILLVLHLVQWLVSSRLNSCASIGS